MQPKTSFAFMVSIKSILPTLILVLFTVNSFSQISEEDKIDATTAKSRKDKFHSMLGSKKALTHAVTFNVDELQEVINQYKAANVKEIPFVFAVIRQEDTDRYAKKRHVSAGDRGKVAEQPTLLIKGPPNGSASLKRMNFAAFYYDIGSICPPPGSCIE